MKTPAEWQLVYAKRQEKNAQEIADALREVMHRPANAQAQARLVSLQQQTHELTAAWVAEIQADALQERRTRYECALVKQGFPEHGRYTEGPGGDALLAESVRWIRRAAKALMELP